MGERANLVILQKGKWQLFYDHWCANRLDFKLFWGPEIALDFIKRCDPTDSWLNETWCEGAVLIDQDSHNLIWFGGTNIDYDVQLRRTFIELIKPQWPNWKIHWAIGGLVEIGQYLGLSSELFLVDFQPREKFILLTEDPEINDVLLTVKKNGLTQAIQVFGDPETLAFGSSQLADLLKLPFQKSLVLSGEDPPGGGVHIDLDTHNLYHWWGCSVHAIDKRVSQGWPGWQTYWIEDQFEKHLKLASPSIEFVSRNKVEMQKEILSYLRNNCRTSRSEHAKHLRQCSGRTINLLPEASHYSISTDRKRHQLLDSLEQELLLD